MEIIEHHGDGTAQQSQHKQGGQRTEGKAQSLDLGGKLAQQEEILFMENSLSLFPDITDNPGRDTGIKQIDGEHQADEEYKDGFHSPVFVKKQQQGEEKQKEAGKRQQPAF